MPTKIADLPMPDDEESIAQRAKFALFTKGGDTARSVILSIIEPGTFGDAMLMVDEDQRLVIEGMASAMLAKIGDWLTPVVARQLLQYVIVVTTLTNEEIKRDNEQNGSKSRS